MENKSKGNVSQQTKIVAKEIKYLEDEFNKKFSDINKKFNNSFILLSADTSQNKVKLNVAIDFDLFKKIGG